MNAISVKFPVVIDGRQLKLEKTAELKRQKLELAQRTNCSTTTISNFNELFKFLGDQYDSKTTPEENIKSKLIEKYPFDNWKPHELELVGWNLPIFSGPLPDYLTLINCTFSDNSRTTGHDMKQLLGDAYDPDQTPGENFINSIDLIRKPVTLKKLILSEHPGKLSIPKHIRLENWALDHLKTTSSTTGPSPSQPTTNETTTYNFLTTPLTLNSSGQYAVGVSATTVTLREDAIDNRPASTAGTSAHSKAHV